MSEYPHRFDAVAFAENFALREVSALFPAARPAVEGLRYELPAGGAVFFYPFGAVVFHQVEPARREEFLAALPKSWRGRGMDVVHEDFHVVTGPGRATAVTAGTLEMDRMTPAREGVVALTVAQSAAMEYYERIVEALFVRTTALVGGLERRGKVPLAMRSLHRFIGQAVGIRCEVLSILHLLDKPDAVWDDPAMDEIYDDLRDEFDLSDRFEALEIKIAAAQESLTLLLGAARDRRVELLEIAIVLLIVIEIVLGLAKMM